MADAAAADGSGGDGTTSVETPVRIETELAADGTTVVVAIDGELTMFSSAAFKSTMLAAMQRPPGAVVVDLTSCTFIDSSGLNAIAHANELLDGGTPRISLVVAHPHLLRLLEITHLADLLPVYGTRAAALSGHGSSLRVHANDAHLAQHSRTADGQRRDTDVAL